MIHNHVTFDVNHACSKETTQFYFFLSFFIYINRIAFPKRCIFIVVFVYTYLNALIVYEYVIVVVCGTADIKN